MPLTRIAQFELGPTLGAGGMGEVFRARDTRLNRDVAVKVLLSDFKAPLVQSTLPANVTHGIVAP
jgi:serine/threonine protein kinase